MSTDAAEALVLLRSRAQRLDMINADLPDIFTRATAMEQGYSHDQVVRRVRNGRWRRLRSGVYCLEETWQLSDRRAKHLMLARAALLAHQGQRCLSHVSAAAWHGLPLPFGDLKVWLTGTPEAGTWYDEQVRVLACELPAAHLLTEHGISVTTLCRTVADCLRHLATEDALIVGDAALRQHAGVGADVGQLLDSCGGWPFVRLARQRLPLLDGRRESALESASFSEMVRFDLPLPEPQVWITNPSGRAVARVDFWWRDRAVVGEVDGLVKYGMGTDDDVAASRRALVDEKRREDRLRELGVQVVRWGLAELRAPGWADWLRQQLLCADPSRFTGGAVSRLR